MKIFAGVFILLLAVGACRSKDEKASDKLYCDYIITGNEDAGYVTVRLQFRNGDANGNPVELQNPASVSFDGAPLTVDSARMSGAYYEVLKPLAEFAGTHTIEVRTSSGKTLKDKFDYRPFFPADTLPAELQLRDQVIQMAGLDSGAVVRILINDTAALSRGVDRLDTLPAGALRIRRSDLALLSPGPIFLELLKEQEINLMDGKSRRGRLLMTFGLKRELSLRGSSEPGIIH